MGKKGKSERKTEMRSLIKRHSRIRKGENKLMGRKKDKQSEKEKC